MSIHKEASFGDVCYAFTGFAKEKERLREPTKVEEIVGSKCRSKHLDVGDNGCWKDGVHRFSSPKQNEGGISNVIWNREENGH